MGLGGLGFRAEVLGFRVRVTSTPLFNFVSHMQDPMKDDQDFQCDVLGLIKYYCNYDSLNPKL